MKILAISGSARQKSTNTALLRSMHGLAPADVELSILDRLDMLPIFSPDNEGEKMPIEVQHLMASVSTADGIIISSPEYAHAIPRGLKNAIDWMVSCDAIISKPIALVHASHRGDDMLASLRLVLATVSDGFLAHIFLRIPLVGKSPEEIMLLLRMPEYESQLMSFLYRFTTAICQNSARKYEKNFGIKPRNNDKLKIALDRTLKP